MPEKLRPVETVQVDYVCDKCGIGHMELTGRMLLSDPPKWPHECTNCCAERTFDVKYPTVRYRFL